jgi:hypothetical protein
MFLILLIATILISLVISWSVVRILSLAIGQILHRITSDETSRAWLKYVKFAIYVAGILNGSGVSERDVIGLGFGEFRVERLSLEIYGTIIGALRGIFWFLAYFLIGAAIAFVIVRVVELIKTKPVDTQDRA